jgi:hypothetical protein
MKGKTSEQEDAREREERRRERLRQIVEETSRRKRLAIEVGKPRLPLDGPL